ncbi:hypothetical protein M0R45_006894 [Rubus argutus]|uniref:Uncharacterized protein n=1 Tax=Rubus argutus TaxID=59490 RepID=A0AAW1YRY3_RUBAR
MESPISAAMPIAFPRAVLLCLQTRPRPPLLPLRRCRQPRSRRRLSPLPIATIIQGHRFCKSTPERPSRHCPVRHKQQLRTAQPSRPLSYTHRDAATPRPPLCRPAHRRGSHPRLSLRSKPCPASINSRRSLKDSPPPHHEVAPQSQPPSRAFLSKMEEEKETEVRHEKKKTEK